MKLLAAILVGLLLTLTGCGEADPPPADFSAEVEVARNETAKVDGTDLKIKLLGTGKLIFDDGEITEATIELSGIGDSVETTLEDAGEVNSVDYGGFRIALDYATARGDESIAGFDITAAAAG